MTRRLLPLILAIVAGCATATAPPMDGPALPEAAEEGGAGGLPPVGEEELDLDALARTGGYFTAREESLSFDLYRQLPADQQLERRQQAKRHARLARERYRESISMNHAATAVGYCPYLPSAWIIYAQNLNDAGDYLAARTCLILAGRTMRYEPSERRRAQLMGDYHRLRAVVSYNLGRAERSLHHAREALAIDADDHDLRLLEARNLVDLERFDEAVTVLRAFDDRSPAYARSLAMLGNLEMARGRLTVAEDAFQRAYKYGMRGAIFENDRGRLALEQERYDEAAGHFRSALDYLPGFLEAWNNLGVTLRRAGRLAEARQELERALAHRFDYGPAHFNLAEVLREQRVEGGPDEAARLGRLAYEHYSQALLFGYQPELVARRRAELALSVEDLAAAESDLLRITENPEIEPQVLHLLGRVKMEQGELQIARTIFSMAERRGLRSAELYSDWGEALLRGGDLGGAREKLEAALDRNPDLVITRVNLCTALSQLGELQEADVVLREAERLDPDHPLVQSQREVLRTKGVD